MVYHHRPWITKHDQTISGVACHHRPWIAKLDMTPSGVAHHHGQWAIYMVKRHWLWQCHHRPCNVHTVEWLRAWHAIIVLGKIHDQTTFGVACYHLPSKTHTIGRRAAWHVRMEFRQHTRSDDVRRCMLSSPLGCTSGWITSVLACDHRPWETYTVELCRAWHALMNLGQHTRSANIGNGMPLSPLKKIHRVKRRQVWLAIISLG